MTAYQKTLLKRIIMVSLFLVVAIVIPDLKFAALPGNPIGRVVEISIVTGLISYWGISVVRRVVNSGVRHCLLHIAIILIIFFLIRSIKYEMTLPDAANRFMWYLFYLPQILVAFFFFAATDFIVTKEKKRRVNNMILMFIPSALLIALVLTNELHHFVFAVNPVTGGTIYRPGYFFVAGWMMIVCVLSIVRIPVDKKTEDFKKRYILPGIVLFLFVLYCLLYISPIRRLVSFLDYTFAYCVFVVLFLESLLLTGLIHTSRDYDWCFNHSMVNSQILDKDGNAIYRSVNARPIVAEEFLKLTKERVISVDQKTEVVMVPIRGGYVAWERDVYDINRQISKLTETRAFIKEATDSLRENIEIEKRQKTALERNRLYDITFSKVSDSVSKLEELVSYARRTDGEKLYKTLLKIDVLGVYVKRKSNLIILHETGLSDFYGELKLCFKESFDNLKDGGINGDFLFRGEFPIGHKTALSIYETFETFLESMVEDLLEVNVIVSPMSNCVNMVSSFVCKKAYDEEALRKLKLPEGVFAEWEIDGEEVTVSVVISKGGAL